MAADHTAHRHGGDPAADFQRLGLAPRPVLDFSVNINPLGPPPEITAAWNGWCDDIHRYPTPDGRGVTRYYEERFGLAPASVAAGNGSTELIYLVPRALGLKTAAVATPAFHDYRRSILVNGGKVVEFPAMAGTEEEWERKVVELLPRAQALWVGNPNNPTGRLIEAVVAAVGFVGAGAILRARGENQVQGLNTASSLLMAASIGIAAGLGHYALALGASLLCVLVLAVFRRVEARLGTSPPHPDRGE